MESNLATKHDLKELELRLIIRMGAIQAATIAILATLMKLIHQNSQHYSFSDNSPHY